MSDLDCYKCGTGICSCPCINCGGDQQMINETLPMCISCFGIVLATGKQFDPKKAERLELRPVAVGKQKRKPKGSRKEALLGFLKDQGWTKRVCQQVLDSL